MISRSVWPELPQNGITLHFTLSRQVGNGNGGTLPGVAEMFTCQPP